MRVNDEALHIWNLLSSLSFLIETVLLSTQNIGSFEYPKHVLKLIMDKKKRFNIFMLKICFYQLSLILTALLHVA